MRGPSRPLRSLAGRRHRRRREHRHVSPRRSESGIPRAADAPGRGRGAGRHAVARHRPAPPADHRPVRVGCRLTISRARWCATHTFTSGPTPRGLTATRTGRWRDTFNSSEAGLTAVERGTADYDFDGVPQDRLSEAQTRFASQLYVTPSSGTTALILNTRAAPFTDVRVRRAINYAVDRAKVARLLGQDSPPPLPDTARRPSRLSALLPLHGRPQPGRGRWQAPEPAAQADRAYRRLGHARDPDHDLEPPRRNLGRAGSIPGLAP